MMEYNIFANKKDPNTLLEYRSTNNEFSGIEYNPWHKKKYSFFKVLNDGITVYSFETLKETLSALLNESKIDELIYIDPIVWKYL